MNTKTVIEQKFILTGMEVDKAYYITEELIKMSSIMGTSLFDLAEAVLRFTIDTRSGGFSMATFCTCGSLVINNGCTNKSCSKFLYTDTITYKQLEYIKGLKEQLGEEYDNDKLKAMTTKEASALIDELNGRM